MFKPIIVATHNQIIAKFLQHTLANVFMLKSIKRLCVLMFLGACMSAGAETPGYRVAGQQILQGDTPVQLRGINWFGFETELHTVHGLWQRNWQETIAQMQGLKINAVRIPLCPASLQGVTPGGIDYDLNSDLRGLNSLAILDKIVAELDGRGMHVLIDHHRPDCAAISELWYTDDYSEKQWIEDLVFIAERYKAYPHFMGIDLKNEPHGTATWGTGNRKTDWNTAAEKAAKSILAAAPNSLIFVEGIENTSRCTDAPAAWWGGNLGPMKCTPLNIKSDRLVLSPHVYGPDVHQQSYFADPDFPDNLSAVWEAHFGQFADDGFALIPGEFGGRYGHAGDPRDRVWQNALVKYLRKKNITSGFYWSWNPNSGDTGGVLQDDWQTAWPDKIALLNHFWFGTELADLPPTEGNLAPSYKRKAPADKLETKPVQQSTKNLSYQVALISDWDAGYCVDVTVSNAGNTPLNWALQMPAEGQINNLWNARHERGADNSGNIRVSGQDWNQQLAAGGQTHFGYCATRPVTEGKSGNDVALARLQAAPPVAGKVHIQSRWQTGYCAEVSLNNSGATPVAWQAELKIRGQVDKLWRGDFTQQGDQLSVRGRDYNRNLAPNAAENFGFCAKFD